MVNYRVTLRDGTVKTFTVWQKANAAWKSGATMERKASGLEVAKGAAEWLRVERVQRSR